MSDTHNCPNCGAVIHDYICDYCGTVFPSTTDRFVGKRCMLIAVDDDDMVSVMGLNVHGVESRQPESFTLDTTHYSYLVNEVTISGSVEDLPVTSHGLRELKRIFGERFGDK